MAAPMASPEPNRGPEFDRAVTRLSDDFGVDPADVDRRLARTLERYREARVRQFVMLLAERDVRRTLRRQPSEHPSR